MLEPIIPIEGWEGYFISEEGNIYSNKRGGLLRLAPYVQDGYYLIELWNGGKGRKVSVHRLVALHFIPNPDNLPNVLFKDGNKLNVRVSNLYWADCGAICSGEAKEIRKVKKKARGERMYEGIVHYKQEALSLGYTPVPNFPHLFASTLGKIYWVNEFGLREKIPFEGRRGYLKVRVSTGGKRTKDFLVHRLIALSFLGEPPEDKPLVCHKDGNHLNNRISNLYYGDHSDNALDAMLHGTKAKKLTETEVREIRELYPSIGYKKLAKLYKVSRSNIRAIVKGKIWFHLSSEEE